MPVVVSVIGGLVVLAMVSVIVSKNAQTPSVVQAGGSALASVIGAATAPVTGAQSNVFGSVSQNVGGVAA